MKTITILFFSFVLFGCATTKSGGADATAEKEILAATDLWRAAYDSRNAARVNALYGKGAVFWGTTMKSIATSPEAIASYFKDVSTRPNARVVFTEQHIRIYGDVAFNSGAYTFKDIRDEKEINTPARFSMVFQRQEGIWVLVHHHSSRTP